MSETREITIQADSIEVKDHELIIEGYDENGDTIRIVIPFDYTSGAYSTLPAELTVAAAKMSLACAEVMYHALP